MRMEVSKIFLFTLLSIYAWEAFGQSGDPSWLQELDWQLVTEKQCEVEYYVRVHEGKIGGGRYQEARVQCRDGRRFDANRINPDIYFTIKPCAAVVC